jgi:hypothetical protein
MDDVVAGAGAIAALELGQAVAPGRYSPYYHLSLGLAGGSDVVAHDWSV